MSIACAAIGEGATACVMSAGTATTTTPTKRKTTARTDRVQAPEPR